MDVFAHGLWTYAIYYKKKYRLLATLFGVAPDLFAFGFFFLHNLITNSLSLSRPSVSSIPEYVFMGYNFSHSLVIFFFVVGIVYFITREIPWVMGGWLLHILIDIPSHTREFFPTPFLWPISSFKISGISWGNKYFMITNYTALILVYAFYVIPNLKRSKKN